MPQNMAAGFSISPAIKNLPTLWAPPYHNSLDGSCTGCLRLSGAHKETLHAFPSKIQIFA